jgi:hypothetical protein
MPIGLPVCYPTDSVILRSCWGRDETVRAMVVQLNVQVSWRAERDVKTGEWVAVCDALKLTAQGETWEDLTSMIFEVQDHLFRTVWSEGALDQFLWSHGWQPAPKIQAELGEDVKFDFPTKVIPVNGVYAQA